MLKTIMAIAGSVIVFFCAFLGIEEGDETKPARGGEVIRVSFEFQIEIENAD